MRQRAAGVVLVILGMTTAPGAQAEWASRGATSPRKVVVATTMYNLYGEHPGVEKRLAEE